MKEPQPELLAKSPRGAKRLTLVQHLLETERAACALFRADTRWARSFLRFFKLERPEDHGRFLLHLQIAALFHDIGKANEDFQAAMVANGFKEQSLRHEHLSALFMCEPSVCAWLGQNRDLDTDALVAAVLSHHLKAARDGDWTVLRARHGAPTALFFDDTQVHTALRRIADVAALPAFAGSIPAQRYYDLKWSQAWEALGDRADAFDRQLRRDAPRLHLTLALKAGLIACDSVSSGLWREEKSIEEWVDGVAHAPPLLPGDVDAQVLEPRIAELGPRWTKWQDFQLGAPSVGRRGLLLAACGSGKTLAAWRWAAEVTRHEEVGRVIFLYPTRGTATEGFRDYVAHAPEGESALVHGTSAYELAGMMQNPDDSPASLRGKSVAVDEAEARLFSLGLWSKRYFSATVDQFLGFIENSYRGLCLLPALADAAIVFDEVHSYDASMWNALISFLHRFDVPVLCMTATLPPTRRQQLERDGRLTTYPSAAQMEALSDLDANETHPRYTLASTTRDEALAIATKAVSEGARVLWVVNTVRRCQQLARALRAATSVPVGVYHSRFRLEDRQRRHRETIDAFRAPRDGEPAAAIAVTTQVCEMSLDLDADVLITEHAPISSLVQRFGRANRHRRRGDAFRAQLLTYEPESNAPYERKDLDAAKAFIAELAGRETSQRALAEGLERHARAERDVSGETSFISGGFYATPGALRDSDDVGEVSILDGDIARFRELEKRREPTDGLRLTVPKKYARAAESPGLPVWLKTAESARYDPLLGFVVDDDVTVI